MRSSPPGSSQHGPTAALVQVGTGQGRAKCTAGLTPIVAERFGGNDVSTMTRIIVELPVSCHPRYMDTVLAAFSLSAVLRAASRQADKDQSCHFCAVNNGSRGARAVAADPAEGIQASRGGNRTGPHGGKHRSGRRPTSPRTVTLLPDGLTPAGTIAINHGSFYHPDAHAAVKDFAPVSLAAAVIEHFGGDPAYPA